MIRCGKWHKTNHKSYQTSCISFFKTSRISLVRKFAGSFVLSDTVFIFVLFLNFNLPVQDYLSTNPINLLFILSGRTPKGSRLDYLSLKHRCGEISHGYFWHSYQSAYCTEESSIRLIKNYSDKNLRRQLITMSIKTTANWSLMPWNFTWIFLTKLSVSKSFEWNILFSKDSSFRLSKDYANKFQSQLITNNLPKQQQINISLSVHV